MKTKVLIGWAVATILCEGVAHAQAQPPAPQRAAAKAEPPSAVNNEPARLQPAPKAVRQVVKPTAVAAPAPAAKAPAADEGPYGADEAEGDDGANGTKPAEGSKASEGAKPTVAPKPAASTITAAAGPPGASAPVATPVAATPVAVDGSVMMGMMGGNMNQTMRRGVTAQVTKVAKGLSIVYVSDDPKIVERLQQMADAIRLIRDAWSE